MDPSNAAELVARSAAGDQRAFADLYDQLAPMVFGVVRRLLRDPAQSEEVTQEVFVELWRNADRFDPARGSVRPWAATVAHRRAVDRVRSEQAHRDRTTRDAENAIVTVPGPEDATVAGDQEQRAGAALRRLQPAQRQAITLAYYDGLTHVQIADQLGVALGTVKTRIRDGLLRLRAMEEVTG